MRTTIPERFLVISVLAVLAYEWLVSGLDKVLSGDFVTSLHHEMMDGIANAQYGFYAKFLQKYCMAHCVVIGYLVEVGEIAVGLSFLILAASILFQAQKPFLSTLGIVTGLIGAFMTLNFFFYQGGSVFINTSDPFDEGIPVDLILALIQLGITVYFGFYRKESRRRQQTPASIHA